MAQAAEKTQYTCTNGDLVRRVIVEVGDLTTSLPCEVVYWKDKEAPGVRAVLWNASSDAAFCDGKAAGLIDTLSNAGWSCTRNGEAVQTSAQAAPSEQSTAPAPAPAAVPALDAATVGQREAAPAPATETQIEQPQTTAALGTEVQPQSAPAPSEGTASTAVGSEDIQTAAVTPTAPSAAASVDQLETVIQANLSSLNQSVDGDFQAQIGDFGDLNADGIEDAVVFFNYESSTADFTQFVAAYLFNGQNYHLAATKPVGGTDLAVRQVEVETIVDGSIQLRLLLNDASQTEDRRAAMILKDGQLVETE